jgi:amidohydrolase
MPSLHVGTFGYCNHAIWASSDNLYITLKGKEAHGAYPHEGVDAIQMAASLIPNILSIPAKIVDTQNPCTLTIGTLEAGTAHNIVAGKAALTGTLRTLDEVSRKTALAQIERLVERTATAFGGTGEFIHRVGAKAVVNNTRLQAQLVDILGHQADPANVVLTRSQMGAEDFSAFSRSVPGCYLLLGTGNPEKGIVHPIHTPQFNVDEACIPFAVSHMSEALLKLGKQWTELNE